MGTRREGREAAIQFLYQRDLHHDREAPSFDEFWRLRPSPGRAGRRFAESLALGVVGHQELIDERLRKAVDNYEIERLGVVDRNVLRLAVYEMFHCPETPPVVAMNEAIDLSKRLGDLESGGFVNGVLDRLKKDLQRPLRQAQQAESA